MNITLAPNITAVQIPPPVLIEIIDEWQLYAKSISPTAVFELSTNENLNFLIQAEVIRQGECDGESFRKKITHVIQGHEPDMIVMENPLAAGISPEPPYGFPWPGGHCTDLDHLHVISQRVGLYVDLCHHFNVRVSLSELWPQHPMELIIAFINLVNDACRSKGIDRFVLNWDPYAGSTQLELNLAIINAIEFCKATGIEFAPIVSCHSCQPSGVTMSSDEFIHSARAHWRRLRQCGSFDRVVVQSWARGPIGEKDIPPTSALITLSEEIIRND